jgi:hypothetical protein
MLIYIPSPLSADVQEPEEVYPVQPILDFA